MMRSPHPLRFLTQRSQFCRLRLKTLGIRRLSKTFLLWQKLEKVEKRARTETRRTSWSSRGDDIGQSNVSAYTNGEMGYRTPNIDSVAREGVMFTDYYAEQSCTAGRAAFITGQSVFRTGLSKVGMPGADIGLSDKIATIAEALKPLGYITGQFGKNHLGGSKDEFLPPIMVSTNSTGNLYHLNAEEEPELPDSPRNCRIRKKFGPRGVIHSFANGKIEDTGPLTKKRMEAIDDDVAEQSAKFIKKRVTRRASPSLLGSTSHTCTFARTRSLKASGKPDVGRVSITTR